MLHMPGLHTGGPLVAARRLFRTAILSVSLVVSLVMPLTASCQHRSSDPSRGITELRSLVESAQGHPEAADLQRIEAANPRSRAAALARFLRGYLCYTSQNYSGAIDALDSHAIGDASAIGDYAMLYRAESES